jgi:nitrous oxide reductase accessory protein NosL
MMSGRPLDNTWMDAYALFSLLRGHQTGSLTTMNALRFRGVPGAKEETITGCSGTHVLGPDHLDDGCRDITTT